jgi:hypothetical protein
MSEFLKAELLKKMLGKTGFQYNQNVFSVKVRDILDYIEEVCPSVGTTEIDKVELKYVLEFLTEHVLKGWEDWKDHIHYDLVACLEDVGLKTLYAQKVYGNVADKKDDSVKGTVASVLGITGDVKPETNVNPVEEKPPEIIIDVVI